MRLVQRGIANNFGLVGKNIRRYLTTTALTATGLMAIATPALAEGSWSNMEVLSGGQTVTTPNAFTTNIDTHTMDVSVKGDANIAATDTVNINQLSDKSKYIVYDTKSDPTKIMGKLNANGRVYIFDKNGVIFGEGSQVNVGSIIAGAGEGVVDPDSGSVELKDVAAGGAIVNDGSITVAEGGLAAFVAPSVVNNGVINAKAGTVALASGNTVTLDLYGDGLVSVAVDGELSNAIVENKGTINASGGNVALTVAAAKGAVDSVVNMDGIIDVSSKTGKGGKVSINGGKKGAVNVAGKIDASGAQGGTVDVKGQNINVAATSVTQAAGLDAKVDFIAKDHMDFRGSVLAKGAAVEVSGYGSLGFSGLVDAKTLLLDPTWAVIHSGILNNPLGLGYVLSAQALANSMQSGTLVTVQADDFIDVGTRNTAYNTGNVAVDAILNSLIGTGDIDLSTYNYDQLEVVGFTTVGPCPFCVSIPTLGLVNYTGTTQSDIKFQSNTINFNKNLKMGDGDVIVDATNVNLFARLYDKVGGLLGDARISSNADKVNVVSNAATIQQGVWLADDAGGATVEVGDGIYTENISINKGLKLVSKNGRGATKIEGISGAGAEATVQIENGANNVQLGDIGKGFTIVGIDNGNAAIENAAVYLRGNHSNIDIIGNEIVANGDLALLSIYAGVMSDINIDSNIFSGKTFNGAAPATGDQFVVPNVARPLVFFGNTSAKSDIKFTNNQVTGTAGAGSAGNLLVNIDSTGATITGNTFNGTTGGSQGSLRARGTNTFISGNTFYAAGLPSAGYHVYVTPSAYAGSLGQDDILDIWNSNTFVGRATVTDSDLFAGFDFIGLTIQGAVDASTATGADIYVNGGATYNESVLVNKSAYLHGANAGKAGYDLTRGPESIVDPNSPGFKVVADNVTIDGFLITDATGADGYGVWVDNGADNAVIKNNIIKNVSQNGVFADTGLNTEISANQIDNTGSHGILVKNSKDARILSNYVGKNGGAFNINGDDIQIDKSHGAWVKYNKVANATSTVDNIGSGVHSISSNNVVIEENKTDNTQWDGVRVNMGSNALVKKNDIDNAVRTGVYLGQTTGGSTALENDIDGVGRYGINLDRGSNVIADGNFIDGTGLDGIRAGNNVKSTIKNNKIGQSGGVNNIKGNGIIADAGSNTTIESNIVGNTVIDGIHVLAVNGAKVLKNDVDITGDEGIHMVNAVGTLLVSENTVDKTKKHGIRITNSDAVKVLTNYVGLTGGAKNINGDGIRIEESDDVLAQYNQVTNTRSPHNNQGNGIQSLSSNRTQILDNILWNTAWDGVRVEIGNDVKVERNDIDNTVRSGVYVMNTVGTIIKDNFMDNLGHRGVYVYGGEDITVDNNNIDFALGSNPALNDGIRAENVSGIVIKNNTIGADGGPNTIGRHGIFALGNTDLTVLNNVIQNAVADGIHAENTSNPLLIELNDIDDVGGDGIDVYGFDTVLVENNDVRDAVENGMLIQYGDEATVTGNVGLGGTDNGVSNVGKNGIKVGHVDDVFINNNEVQLAGWDGIHVEYFNTALIENNLVEQSGDDGIEAHNGIQVEINNNTILNSGYGVIIPEEGGEDYDGYDEFASGHDGIHVTNITGSSIEYLKSGLAKVVAEVGSAFIRITDNTINVSSDDGVDVDNSTAYTYVVGNTITNSGLANDGETIIYPGMDTTGADGINIDNVGQPYYFYDVVREGDAGNGEYNIVVAGNSVTNSQDDGIEVVGSYVPYATSYVSAVEAPYEEEYEYDYVGNTGRVLVQENSVLNSGWGATGFGDSQGNGADGIHVRNVYPGYDEIVVIGESEGGFYGYAVDVLGNTVTNSGDDGVEVAYSESTLIDDNTIKNSGFTSEGSEEPEETLFAKISESDYGADSIHVRNVGYAYKIVEDDEGYDDYAYAKSLPGYGYQPYSVVIRRNDVDKSQDNGIQVHNDMWFPTAPVLVEINENVSDSGNQALYISGPSHTNVIVRGNAFSNFDTGGQFESGLIDLSQIGNSWTNGNIGLRFSPFNFGGEAPSWANLNLVDVDGPGSTPYPTTPTNFGGTIGAQTFTGFTEDGKFYVYLDDGAFQNEGTPIWINGLDSTYDGIQPSLTGGLLSEADYNYLEARFQHFPDNATTDIFWFGFVPATEELPLIEQSLIFNRFNVFNGDATGLNVQILSLPSLGGGQGVNPAALNQIGPFAGNNATDPSSLNNIETAAGGEGQPNATQLNNIETAAGGESQSCWGNAVAAAGNGQVVNVAYTGGVAANLNMAATCGTGF